MAKISLRNYNRLIENLIDNGKRDEAIAHCRHILQTFSKYVEAYRLLGKAFLEAKRYDDAVDIFQRVLMCVPDDFVSNVGLSIIADDQGKLDEAIWHMERAFEVQPSNAAIQGELQRLFGRRDGSSRPRSVSRAARWRICMSRVNYMPRRFLKSVPFWQMIPSAWICRCSLPGPISVWGKKPRPPIRALSF